MRIVFFVSILFFSRGVPVFAAEELIVGVAANFMVPFKEIARVFEKKTSIKVLGTYASSGNLYGQIKNGAPYDLYLSADRLRPDRLTKIGLAERAFIYARGEVIVWTAKGPLCSAKNWRLALGSASVRRISIANPETAPYGEASVAALKSAGLWEVIEPKLVFARNVIQAFQYAHTEAVDAGFCVRSFISTERGKEGCHFFVKEAPPVIQAACVLKRSGQRATADEFSTFLTSSEAAVIKNRFGYE